MPGGVGDTAAVGDVKHDQARVVADLVDCAPPPFAVTGTDIDGQSRGSQLRRSPGRCRSKRQ
jgi:hypothetical protein